MFGLGKNSLQNLSSLTGETVTAEALMALEFAPALSKDIPTLSLAQRAGMIPTRAAGQGHIIRDLRPFVEGDDPRHIDPAASARSGTLHLRSFHEDREGNLLLIADFRRPMLWGTSGRLRSVAAAEVLMRLGWRAIADGGAVGLVTLTDMGMEVSAPRPRRAGILRVAGHMARAHAAALAAGNSRQSPPLDKELAAALRHAPKGAMIALASGLDEAGQGLKTVLASLAAGGPLSLLLIEDAFERRSLGKALPTYRQDDNRPTFLSFDGLSTSRDARPATLNLPGLRVLRFSSSADFDEPRR